MAGRRIKSEGGALEALDCIGKSGVDMAGWCRARGVDTRSLTGWRGVLQARGHQFQEPQFVELVARPPEPTSAAGRLRVACGAFTVEVDGSFDEVLLVRLLRVVAAC